MKLFQEADETLDSPAETKTSLSEEDQKSLNRQKFELARLKESERIIRTLFERALCGNSPSQIDEIGKSFEWNVHEIAPAFFSHMQSQELLEGEKNWLKWVILSAYWNLSVPPEIDGTNFFALLQTDFLYYFEKFCIDVLEPRSGVIAVTFKNRATLQKRFKTDVARYEHELNSANSKTLVSNKNSEPKLKALLREIFGILFYLQYGIGELLTKTPYLSPNTPEEISDTIKKRTEWVLKNNPSQDVVPISMSESFPRPREIRDFVTHIYKEHSINDREVKDFLDWLGAVEIVFEWLLDFSEHIEFCQNQPITQSVDERSDPEMFACLQMTLMSLSYLLQTTDTYIGKKSVFFKNLLAKGLGVQAISLQKLDSLENVPVNEFLACFSDKHVAAGFDLFMQFSGRFWNNWGWTSLGLRKHLCQNPEDIPFTKKILRLACAQELSDEVIIELLESKMSWNQVERVRDEAGARVLLAKLREQEAKKIVAVRTVDEDQGTYIHAVKAKVATITKKKVKTHGTPNASKRLTDLFSICRLPLSKERSEKFEETPKELIDYAFTCAKRSGARDEYVPSFEYALLHALEERSEEPLQRYMAEFEQTKLLRLLPAHPLDKEIWSALQKKSLEQQGILAVQVSNRIEHILRAIDPSKLSSTMQNKSGRGTGSTAARIESLIKAVRRNTGETDGDFLMRICTFNWETHVQHLPIQLEDVRDGKTKYLMEHLPKWTVGFHACIVALLENLEDLKNRDVVDLSTLASVFKNIVRHWDRH